MVELLLAGSVLDLGFLRIVKVLRQVVGGNHPDLIQPQRPVRGQRGAQAVDDGVLRGVGGLVVLHDLRRTVRQAYPGEDAAHLLLRLLIGQNIHVCPIGAAADQVPGLYGQGNVLRHVGRSALEVHPAGRLLPPAGRQAQGQDQKKYRHPLCPLSHNRASSCWISSGDLPFSAF